MQKLDVKKLKTDIKKTTEEILEVKAVLREPHQPRLSWHHYPRLAELKYQATIQCSIRAHSRGKIHLKGFSLSQQEELIEDRWKEYALAVDEAA